MKNGNALYYKRVEVFTIESILKQLVKWLEEHQAMPQYICLPPEERIYLHYLNDKLDVGTNSFCGIPLSTYYDKQELPFRY